MRLQISGDLGLDHSEYALDGVEPGSIWRKGQCHESSVGEPGSGEAIGVDGGVIEYDD